jgi:hypothetical protein
VLLMSWLVANQQSWEVGVPIIIRGDSKLILDFCNRLARPGQQHLYLAMAEIHDKRRQLRGKVIFRHVGRELNTWADWLGRVGAATGQHVDATTTLQGVDPTRPIPWSPASWVEAYTPPQVLGAIQHELGGGLSEVIRAARAMEPSFADRHVCKVCLGAGQAKQCWGCGFWWHPRCLGLQSVAPGPLYCGTCRHIAKEDIKEDYTYDEALMQYVTTGVM